MIWVLMQGKDGRVHSNLMQTKTRHQPRVAP